MGKVQPRDGEEDKIDWFDRRTGDWRAAVYHDDIRDSLIAGANALGNYRYPRAKGKLYNDITSFHPDHKDWGPLRAQWPAILYQYKPLKSDIHSKEKPDIWITNKGEVVLDREKNPILAYQNLPLTISSKIESAYLEAFTRTNCRITFADIRARMLQNPTDSKDGDKDPIRMRNMSMNMTRFRERSGMIAWKKREGRHSIEEYLDSILPEECIESNSIEQFRNLHPYEIMEMKAGNKGQFPERKRKKNRTTEDEEVDETTPIKPRGSARAANQKRDLKAANGKNSEPTKRRKRLHETETVLQPYVSEQYQASKTPSKRRKVNDTERKETTGMTNLLVKHEQDSSSPVLSADTTLSNGYQDGMQGAQHRFNEGYGRTSEQRAMTRLSRSREQTQASHSPEYASMISSGDLRNASFRVQNFTDEAEKFKFSGSGETANGRCSSGERGSFGTSSNFSTLSTSTFEHPYSQSQYGTVERERHEVRGFTGYMPVNHSFDRMTQIHAESFRKSHVTSINHHPEARTQGQEIFNSFFHDAFVPVLGTTHAESGVGKSECKGDFDSGDFDDILQEFGYETESE